MMNKVEADYLEENIDNDIRLIVDMQGTSARDVEKSDSFVSEWLDSELYSRREETYTYEDINEWDQRMQRPVTNVAKRRIMESEKVIRYVSEDENEEISIGKLYIEIKLMQGRNFNLKEKMILLQNLVKKYISVNPFIRIENIFLIKKNNIICENLSSLYTCYNAAAFGDIRVEMANLDIDFTEYCSCSTVILKGYNLTIEKEIVAGDYNKKVAYMGALDFSMSCQMQDDREYSNVSATLKEMDKSIFEILKMNLTVPFLNELEKR